VVDEKLFELGRRLLALTRAGKIEWRDSEEAAKTFECNFSDFWMSISDRDGVYFLVVLDPDGNRVGSVKQNRDGLLNDVFEAARQQPKWNDRAVDNLLAQLDKIA